MTYANLIKKCPQAKLTKKEIALAKAFVDYQMERGYNPDSDRLEYEISRMLGKFNCDFRFWLTDKIAVYLETGKWEQKALTSTTMEYFGFTKAGCA